MLGAVPEPRVEDLSDTSGGELLSLGKEKSGDHKTECKTLNNAQTVDENDLTHAKMIESEPLIKAPGERNPRSINLTFGDSPLSVPQFSTYGVVSGEVEPLLDVRQ